MFLHVCVYLRAVCACETDVLTVVALQKHARRAVKHETSNVVLEEFGTVLTLDKLTGEIWNE
jgi:hypothetical protein